MATTEAVAGAPTSDIATAITPLVDSLQSVFKQHSSGIREPTVSFLGLSKFGGEPLDSWKRLVEHTLGSRIDLRVSLETNAITVIPLTPYMSPILRNEPQPVAPGNQEIGDESIASPASDGTTTSASSSKKAGKKGRAKNGPPRPRNAFIIYRGEWHSKIVANFPDMHNNDISVLIGRQWRDEPDEVKRKYKEMAAEEKRQHLIDHPGYQYQPRKPSEKKKRMTKNKLAKLRAQSVDAVQDPMQEIDELLAAAAADNQTTIDTFSTPYQQGYPMITEEHSHNGFIANAEHDDFLFNQLTDWNANQPATQYGAVPALCGQMFVDGQHQGDIPSYPVPASYGMQEVFQSPPRLPASTGIPTAGSNNTGAARNSEVDRHQHIYDDTLISDLFDLDAFDVEVN